MTASPVFASQAQVLKDLLFAAKQSMDSYMP